MKDPALSLSGRHVLVTGGTRGLGKAIAQEFSRVGAIVTITYYWGSVTVESVEKEFTSTGLQKPLIIESNVSDATDISKLMTTIKDRNGGLDTIISNVSLSSRAENISDIKSNTVSLSLQYSTLPIIQLLAGCREIFNEYPKYLIGISSNGPDLVSPGYDLAAVAKASLETIIRYLSVRLRPSGVKVNAVRAGLLDTDSLRSTFGDELIDAIQDRIPEMLLDHNCVARAIVGLCSGWMDSISGQILNVDEGWGLISPLNYLKYLMGPQDGA